MARPEFNTEQRQRAFDAITRLEELVRVMDDLQECGEDCSLRRKQAVEMRMQLDKLLDKFGGQL